ncbi:hypothetical protein J4410_05005 [Candidatus Woesearchaeota archaeon]|nr:hypothetical protein [Candidatus Woesearchaeota archaeon]
MGLSYKQQKSTYKNFFGTSAYTLLIQGWVPTKKVRKVCAELHDLTKGNLFIEEKAATEKEIPILLENKKIWKPFEFFLELFSLPNYKELDPTFLLFLTFPIFFGIMLGDVGYGLVTLFFFLFLRKKIPSLKPLLTVMIYSSLITILFGALYGEYFGFEHLGEEKGQALCAATGICLPRIMEVAEHGELAVEYIYDFPRALNRLHGHINVLGTELLSVLFIGALLGVLHVNLGLLLGFYNTWKAHGFKHALLEKGSWWVLQLGIVLLVLGYLQIGFQPWVGGIIMILAAVMLYLGEGITGIIELPSIFSNMLSYMRLGAVGLASVGLAVVINENLTMPLIEQGGIFVLLGILIFVIGHIINIALGVIGPFLHSLRLHYVEFFTKFYKGGGIAFQPFGKKI